MHAEEDDPETAFLAANLAAIAISIDEIAASAKDDNAYWATYLALTAGVAPAPSKCVGPGNGAFSLSSNNLQQPQQEPT